MAAGRIDTHQHIIPPDYRQLLADRGLSPDGTLPEWSTQAAIDQMGALDIDSAILSVSAPGANIGDLAEARSWARKVNDYTAEVVRENPTTFGMFATVPLPDVDAALEETAYAFDELGADGVILLANHDGIYLGDDKFEPLFEELGRRGAVVFVHPNELPASRATPPLPAWAVDFLLDTTRAAVKMAASGTLDRHPDLTVILSHAGGFLPYVVDRVAPLPNMRDPQVGYDLMRRYWFDLALSSGPSALPSLLEFANHDQVTYGSDFPFSPPFVLDGFKRRLENFELTPELRGAIYRRNAEVIFPRLAR